MFYLMPLMYSLLIIIWILGKESAMSGRTFYDVIFQLLQRYKVAAVAAVAIVFAGGWFVAHQVAKPGTGVSVWGLFQYTKSDDISQPSGEKDVNGVAENEHRPILSEARTAEEKAGEARASEDIRPLRNYRIYIDDDNEALYLKTKKLLLELGLRSEDGICDNQRTFVRYYHANDKQAAILLANTLEKIMPGIDVEFFKKEVFGERTLYVCIL